MNEEMKRNEQYMEALPAADIVDSEKDAVISLEVPGANSQTVEAIGNPHVITSHLGLVDDEEAEVIFIEISCTVL